MSAEINILLVEDDEGHAMLARRCLKRYPSAKVNISCVQNGLEALDLIKKRSENNEALPDLILLDINMPRMNGLELLAIVKHEAKTQHVPIIMLTTSESPSDLKSCEQLGSNGYVVKPLCANDVNAIVESLAGYWTRWNCHKEHPDNTPDVSPTSCIFMRTTPSGPRTML